MNLEELKKKLEEQLQSSSDKDELVNAINSWKTILEAEKVEADIEKGRVEMENIKDARKSDKTKFWIGVVAPLVTAVALVSTLIFQIILNRENGISQRKADEDTQWRSFLQKLNTRNVPNDLSVGIQLNSFLNSTRYRDQALEIASTLYLPHIVDHKVFKSTFDDFAKYLDWNNYYSLVNLTGAIYQQITDERRKLSEDSVLLNINANNVVYKEETIKRIDEVNHAIEESHLELTIVGNTLSRFIKNNIRPDSISLDLSDGFFFHTNFPEIDFNHANLSNTIFDECDVENCKFENIEFSDSSFWDGTAWWRAKAIDNKVLIYLIKRFPYNSTIPYYNDSGNSEVLFSNWVKKQKS